MYILIVHTLPLIERQFKLVCIFRNRDPSSRPSFSQIIDVLFENEDILLKQSTDEVKSTLGASLEEGYTLFEDLQYYYDNV